MMRIGFVGLGAMGRPMALNLMKRGYTLNVFARRPEAAQALVAAGANGFDSLPSMAQNSDLVFTMVTTTNDVEAVILGSGGIAEGAAPGTLVIDTSTIAPDASRQIATQLARSNIEMLDAPVSGGEIGAIKGTLAIMVGGKAEMFDRARPVLEAIGETVVYVGEHGAGQVTKACCQLAIVAVLQGIAEAVALARAAGVDTARMIDVLKLGLAGSRMLELMGARMVERHFAPGVEARLHHKDIHIVLECARQAGVAIPVAALVAQTFNALMAHGGAKLDSSAIVEIIEGARQK